MTKRIGALAVVLLLLLVSMSFASAITGALGNARMILYPEVNGWTTTKVEKSILIKNVNDEAINVSLQIGNETAEFIELVDKTFILEPNTEKKAEFIVRVKKEGTYEGKINVFFSSVNESQKTGVALSAEVIVVARKDQGDKEVVDDEVPAGDGDSVTGGVVIEDKNPNTGSGISKLTLLATGSVVLLLILISLIVVLSKKGGKRRNKVNGRRNR